MNERPDKVAGHLEVGITGKWEVVINHFDLKPDSNGVGHIVFSARQARNLARTLLKKADEADKAWAKALRKAERVKQ